MFLLKSGLFQSAGPQATVRKEEPILRLPIIWVQFFVCFVCFYLFVIFYFILFLDRQHIEDKT